MRADSRASLSHAPLGCNANRGAAEEEQVRRAVVVGLILLSLWSAACQATAITENEAKAIALKHLGIGDESARFHVRVSRDGEDWLVKVEIAPHIFGGDVFVWVARDGKVRHVLRGL
jgi:hypothetical protein